MTDATAAQLREVAHELRNPLNALTAIMEVMKDERFGPLGDPKYGEYATLAHQATGRMLSLCERLLVSGHEDALADDRSAVIEVLTSTVELYRAMADARGVALELDIAEDMPELRINTEALTIVLNNLITNAIKFTPRGGRVSVMARRQPMDNVAVFVVSDTGIGMEAEELARQMRPNDSALAGSVGVHGDLGSGMGLNMVRQVLVRMGGTLELRSRQGVGTCAIIRLPQ